MLWSCQSHWTHGCGAVRLDGDGPEGPVSAGPPSQRSCMPDHPPKLAGRRIALIAHDNKKHDMLEWAEYNLDLLAGHELFATATTGHLLQQLGLPVTCFRSGPYGGDQQIGA